MTASGSKPSKEGVIQPQDKLTFWQKVGYGVADVYGGGSGVLISFYYLVFLVDVVRLRPSLAGTVILISKLYDSVTDPFEGALADRVRTPLGRRRPFIAAGVILVFASVFLMFFPFAQQGESARFVSVTLSYLFFSTVFSIVMLNYNALQSEITLDYDERTRLSSFRIAFSTLGAILAALLPLEIVDASPDVRQGWMLTGLVFGLIFAAPLIWTVLATRERPEFQKPPAPFSLRAAWIEPFRMRAFVSVLMMYLMTSAAIDVLSSLVIFYVRNYLDRADEVNVVSGILVISQVLALVFFVRFSRRTSKRASYMLGGVLWITMLLLSLLVTPALPAWGLYLFAALTGAGAGGMVVMVYAMFPDIPDVDELRSGQRREGTYAAIFTFARKLSSAFAVFVVAQVVDAAGYRAPIEEVIDGAGRLIHQPQSDTFILVLRLIFALVPSLCLILALFFAARYPLSHQAHDRLRAVLNAQRAGQPVDPAESAALERLLFGKVTSRAGPPRRVS